MAYLICGSISKKSQEKKPIPEGCTLVSLPSSYRDIVEEAFFDATKRRLFTNPLQYKGDLKKLFKITDDADLSILKSKEMFANHECNLFSFAGNKLRNSGVYYIGVKKKLLKYVANNKTFPQDEIEQSYEKSTLPQNVVGRLEKAFPNQPKQPNQPKYTYDQIQSVLNSWPFYEDVYEVCRRAKDAVEKGDKIAARKELESLKKNIEIVADSHNKGNEWVLPLLRFRDDLEEVVKEINRDSNTKLQKSYKENIDDRKNQRRGGFKLSFLFKQNPGIYYVFNDESKPEENDEPVNPTQSVRERKPSREQNPNGEPTLEKPEQTENSDEIMPSITSATFQLGNRSFSLDRGVPAYARRSAYFLNNEGSLTKDEQEVLDAIGIDKEMEVRLKPYLPKFFDVLPDCQTDTSLYLSKNCEIPYFVVWSTKFAERSQTLGRIKENGEKAKSMSDYDMAINQAVIGEMHAKYSDIDSLFAIIRTSRGKSKKSGEKPFAIDDLFVLIKVN